MKIIDWDIAIGKDYIQPYLGSYKLDGWGRDFFFQCLGLHLYLALEF